MILTDRQTSIKMRIVHSKKARLVLSFCYLQEVNYAGMEIP